MPSSARLYSAPDGHDATQDGLRTVLAYARQVEHEHLLELHFHALLEAGQVRVVDSELWSAREIVLEVAAPADRHIPAG
jgi:hypothetical protein